MNFSPKPSAPEIAPFARRALQMAGALGGIGLVLGGCTSGTEASRPNETTTTTEATPAISPTPELVVPSSPETSRTVAPPTERTTSGSEVVRGLDMLERRTDVTFTGAMEFFQTLTSVDGRNQFAAQHNQALQQINDAGYKPISVIEPGAGGFNLDTFKLKKYLKAMGDQGVTAKEWGKVVLVADAMVGGPNPINPKLYPRHVDAQREAFQEHFPGIETTILVDTADEEFGPLIESINTSRDARRVPLPQFESVGLQAFPNAGKVTFDPDTGKADISSYLSVNHLQALSEATSTKHVWINTGITREDIPGGFSYKPEERIAIANAVADVARDAAQADITVDEIMLFAQNKSDVPEGRDFSFHEGDEEILETLYERLHAQDITLSGFDVRS